ncbi:peroxiredoxin [Gammaproteobacteria bacterium]|nr:peroxiredoxin [Gammaproteobacteria bacterium]
MNMTISINDKFPTQEIRVLVDGELKNISSDEYFSGKKVVLVGVPGAFTPTCHLTHLPGYIENIENFKAKNYSIVFMAVNDPFVVKSWSEASKAEGIDMIADGNCDLTHELGLTMDGSGFGLGNRCQRFAMIVDDGVIKSIDIEEPGAMDISSADSQLAKI